MPKQRATDRKLEPQHQLNHRQEVPCASNAGMDSGAQGSGHGQLSAILAPKARKDGSGPLSPGQQTQSKTKDLLLVLRTGPTVYSPGWLLPQLPVCLKKRFLK